jgi:Domain of unknown function (DUF4440)
MLLCLFAFWANDGAPRMNQQSRTNPPQPVPLCSFVFFVVLLVFLGCAGAPKHPGWSQATGAEQYERLMWVAIRDHHWDDFERHLAPIFVGANSSGRLFDRDQWVAYWKSVPVKDFSLGEVTVQPQGPDMIVTYVIHTDRGDWRVVSVWQGIKKGWILTTTSIIPFSTNATPSAA